MPGAAVDLAVSASKKSRGPIAWRLLKEPMTSSEFERRDQGGRGPQRAAFAAGAAFAVLVGGAVFLGTVVKRPSVAPPPLAASVPAPAASVGGGDYGAVVWPESRPVPRPPAAREAATASATEEIAAPLP